MMGKSFETVLCLLSIGVLQRNTAFGCQTNSDCSSETTTGAMKQCCYKVFPPKCMDGVMCQYLHGNDDIKPTSAYNPKFTDPDYDRFTPPDYNKFTALPDVKEFAVPNLAEEAPESFEDENDDDDYHGHIIHYDDSDSATQSSAGTIIIVIGCSIFLAMLICLCYIHCCRRPNANSLQEDCNVPPPATTNTSRTNVVAQQREEPSRFVILDVNRDEDHIRHQNRPPDGEPPFLSKENILHNLHNSHSAQQPPPYEEAVTEPHLPQYEGLDNAAMEQPPSPAYSDVQAISQSFMNSSQITPSPNVPPPSYEEALISITCISPNFKLQYEVQDYIIYLSNTQVVL